MNPGRERMSRAVCEIIGTLDLETLTKMHNAERKSIHASAQLGMSSQLAAQAESIATAYDALAALTEYQLRGFEFEFRATVRELDE